MAYPVECVTIDESSDHDDCRCIDHIGIPSKGGGVNTYTPRRIHERIVEDGDEFYVETSDGRTYVEEAEREGTKYVRTEANDTPDDNLLHQDPC